MILISEINYKKISLPEELVNSIQEFMDNNKHLGYTSVVDVVKDSIREKVFTKNEEIAEYIVK